MTASSRCCSSQRRGCPSSRSCGGSSADGGADSFGVNDRLRETGLVVLVLAARLREARTKIAGISQGQVEDRTGIPKARTSRYENGFVVPSLGVLVKFADCYGVSTDWLLGRTDVVKVRQPNNHHRAR